MTEEMKASHGRDKEPEVDDPMELVMTPLPGGDLELMARCLIEEYARIGLGGEEILSLFSRPVYQTHLLYRERGEAWVRDLIRNVLAETGRMRVSVKVFHHPSAGESNAPEHAATNDGRPATSHQIDRRRETSQQQPSKGGCDD